MTNQFEITHIDSVMLDIPPIRDCMFYWDKVCFKIVITKNKYMSRKIMKRS